MMTIIKKTIIIMTMIYKAIMATGIINHILCDDYRSTKAILMLTKVKTRIMFMTILFMTIFMIMIVMTRT